MEDHVELGWGATQIIFIKYIAKKSIIPFAEIREKRDQGAVRGQAREVGLLRRHRLGSLSPSISNSKSNREKIHFHMLTFSVLSRKVDGEGGGRASTENRRNTRPGGVGGGKARLPSLVVSTPQSPFPVGAVVGMRTTAVTNQPLNNLIT